MTAAQRLVSHLLEEIIRDYIFLSGPPAPDGLVSYDLRNFVAEMGQHNPRFSGRSPEFVFDSLVNAGCVIVASFKGSLRVFNARPEVQLSKKGLSTLKSLGLFDFKTVGYSPIYAARPTEVSVEKMFLTLEPAAEPEPEAKPASAKPDEPVTFRIDPIALEQKLIKKFGEATFNEQVREWPKYTERALASYYGLSAEQIRSLAHRYAVTLRR